jgi:hypothetical protein
MPGQAACARCGSLLEAKAGAIGVHPPRAPAWKKPFRWVARRARRFGAARRAQRFARRSAERTAAASFGVDGLPELPRSGGALQLAELRAALRAAAGALALSILPGLAHAVRRQFGAIYLYVLSWFLSLAVGILFFGGSLGSASMACAFVLHAWIAMDAVVGARRFKEKMTALSRAGLRLAGFVALVVLLYTTYGQIQRVIGFTVGIADVAVPANQVALRDAILCRLLSARAEPPPVKRGDLVLVRARASGANFDLGPGIWHEAVPEVVGQLVGLPGDQVSWAPTGFIVNGRQLDPGKFPLPDWLRGDSGSQRLGKNGYFVTMEWRIEGGTHGYGGHADVISLTCVYGRQDLLARGVMRWLPLRKRGFLKELE